MRNTYFGDPSRALQYSAIFDTLSQIHSESSNMLEIAIDFAVHNKRPIAKICEFILESAKANENAVIDIIGKDCLTKIKKLHGKDKPQLSSISNDAL